ncbi:MAG: transglycosylase SLT domain-containing protein [Muribaculaceae bacterium]|nr:transglycosylase SLT domain-containing protein [Muribaculaceae bacterium]
MSSGHRTHGVLPDTLRVGTLYSPSSFFIYRGDSLGYDYELVKRFAADKGMALELHTAPSMARMLEMLDSGLIDIAAYEVPVTGEYKRRVLPCGYENITTQVLVQPSGADRITDVTQLVGRDVYVERDSKYEYRMRNLNAELGGGINIITVDRDTLIAEDLIDMVSTGQIPLTVVDSDVAQINATYYANIDISLPLSMEQRASWAVANNMQWLADSIDAWAAGSEPAQAQKEMMKRYFQLSKVDGTPYQMDFDNGVISRYDNIFRRYAPDIEWDWRMLAAQAYTESKFKPNARSFAGARGLMQIMPRTGRAYGLRNANDPEQSVRAAVRLLSDLDSQLQPLVPDEAERKKFMLAAYNGGLGHVLDAIRLAEKHGMDPAIWDENVAEAALMLSNPQYYNDPVVKYGYLRGRETYNYVKRLMDFYEVGKTAIPV